jgi:catechol 2,3-dioxygenase-like lactoylglutathione lyase family enzyme
MGTSNLKVTGINHIVLHVSDVERSTKFYMKVLGFESRNISVGSERNISLLRCGMQGLDLLEVAADLHGGEEMNHIALNVETDDIDEVEEKLAKAGVEVSERTSQNSVFIHDPDGHKIEILPRSAQEGEREPEAARASA